MGLIFYCSYWLMTMIAWCTPCLLEGNYLWKATDYLFTNKDDGYDIETLVALVNDLPRHLDRGTYSISQCHSIMVSFWITYKGWELGAPFKGGSIST